MEKDTPPSYLNYKFITADDFYDNIDNQEIFPYNYVEVRDKMFRKVNYILQNESKHAFHVHDKRLCNRISVSELNDNQQTPLFTCKCCFKPNERYCLLPTDKQLFCNDLTQLLKKQGFNVEYVRISDNREEILLKVNTHRPTQNNGTCLSRLLTNKFNQSPLLQDKGYGFGK